MSWRSERVTSAQYVKRDKETKGPFKHHGVVVSTSKGNRYLIHSTPESGTVVTPASNMNPGTWVVDHNIAVKGTKTVDGAFKEASGHTLNKLINYATSGTCINTARNAENYLRR